MKTNVDYLVTAFEHDGKWWLAHKQDDKIAGRFLFEGPKVELLLQDFFEEYNHPFEVVNDRTPYHYPIVNGILDNGRRCALLNASRGQVDFSAAPFFAAKTRIHAGLAVIGAHFDAIAEAKFSHVNVRFSCLEPWLDHTGLTKSGEPIDGRIDWGYKVSYEPPEPLAFKAPWGELKFFASHTWRAFPRHEAFLAERMSAAFWFDEPVSPWAAMSDYIGPFRDLLALLVGRPIAILDVRASPKPKFDPEYGIEGAPFEATELQLLFPLDQALKHAQAEMIVEQMLFPMPLVKAHFETILAKWFELYETIDDVLDTYWAVFHADGLSQHHAFQSIVGALEAYHERVLNQDEIHLKDRLAELCTPVLGLVKAEEKVVSQVIDRVTATRHYYAHYSAKRKERKLEGAQLVAANDLLKWAFCLALATKIGIPTALCTERITQNQAFLYFSSYLWPILATKPKPQP